MIGRRLLRDSDSPLWLSIVSLAFACFCLVILPLRAAQDPVSLLHQAETLAQRGDLYKAETLLLGATRSNPGSFKVFQLLGMVYLQERNPARAEAAFKKAMEISGEKDSRTLFLLCKTEFDLKKAPEAMRMAQKLSSLAANDPRAHYALGHLLYGNSQFTTAVVELEKAYSLARDNPLVAGELILALSDSGRIDSADQRLKDFLSSASYQNLLQIGSWFGKNNHMDFAVRSFEQAVLLRHDDYNGLFDLAFALYRQGDFEKSFGILNRVPESERARQADYYYLRGKVEEALHSDQAASNDYLSALSLDPGNRSICLDAGISLRRLKDFQKSLEVFQSCARALPESTIINIALGLGYFHLGKYTNASLTFKKVLRLDPKADVARETLAYMLFISGKFQEARATLEQRTGKPDADYYIYFLEALVLLHQDPESNRRLALNSLHETLLRNPDFAPAHYELAKIELEVGDLRGALVDLTKATRIAPSYAAPYYLMAQIYNKLGERTEAEKAEAMFTSLRSRDNGNKEQGMIEDRLAHSLQ
jgi:Flp pilus assembly protein TadD